MSLLWRASHERWNLTPRIEVASGRPKAAFDEADKFTGRGSLRIDSPGGHIGLFDDQNASWAEQAPIGSQLFRGSAERSDLEAGMHKVEGAGRKPAAKEVVGEDDNVRQSFRRHEGIRLFEHLRIDVGACDSPVYVAA